MWEYSFDRLKARHEDLLKAAEVHRRVKQARAKSAGVLRRRADDARQ